MQQGNNASSESSFIEFRRKVQESELLALGVSQLLRGIHFTGRLSVVIQNGTILKSGYEEGYFTRRDDRRLT
jgi:hypothetical protein